MSKIEKFIREYPVRSYECDRDGQLRLITLLNIFQDVADSHANQMGLGYDFCQTKGLAWVGSNYHIGIDRLPRWHETIKVITWPCEERRLGAIRDFRVEDETGHPIIVAASQWILIDFAKKRPVGLRENLPDYQVIPERALETDFAKLPQPEKKIQQLSLKSVMMILTSITTLTTLSIRFGPANLSIRRFASNMCRRSLKSPLKRKATTANGLK